MEGQSEELPPQTGGVTKSLLERLLKIGQFWMQVPWNRGAVCRGSRQRRR
jgi:hypothetical protein